jgi:hypothetical protein
MSIEPLNGMVQMRRAVKSSGATSTTIRVTVRRSAMRAPVPGTAHSKSLHRDECSILQIVQRSPSVKKLKSGRIENTRSSIVKLQLRPHPLAGKIDAIVSAWLHIGGGKRLVTLYTIAPVTLEALRRELALALESFNVPVELLDDHTHSEEVTMVPYEPNGVHSYGTDSVKSNQSKWPWAR